MSTRFIRLAGMLLLGLPALLPAQGTGTVTGRLTRQNDQSPLAGVSVTVQGITERLDPATWDVVTAGEHTRTTGGASGGHGILRDVVVRAVRRGTGQT